MKLALCSGSFASEVEKGHTDMFSIWKTAVQFGFQGFEVREDLLRDKAKDLQQLHKLARETGIELIYSARLWPVQPDLDTMKGVKRQVLAGMDEAWSIGARYFKLGFGPVSCGEQLGCGHKALLKEMAAHAAEKDIVLCLENSDKPMGSSARLIHDVIGEVASPHAAVAYDCGNFAFAGHDPLEAARILIDDIAYVHLKDYRAGLEAPTWLGNGAIPFSGILGILETSGYDGYYCFEFPMSMHRIEEIGKSIRYLEDGEWRGM